MDIESILQTGAQAFLNNQQGSTSSSLEQIAPALLGLLQNDSGNLDLSRLLSIAESMGLTSMIEGWFGGGSNGALSGEHLEQMFGSDKLQQFAQSLNISDTDAKSGLGQAIPAIIDHVTSSDHQNGDILDDIGGVSGAWNLINKLF